MLSRNLQTPSPLLVLGAALGAGVLLARWLDGRGHAHRRA
jgi:hypothetical protein